MSGSLAEWLSLREAADGAARSVTLTRAVANALSSRSPLRIVDLGTGTGSNIRYLAPRLPSPQEWLAVDREADLLSRIVPPSPSCRIVRRQANLGALDAALFVGCDLVTASALLDLVSASWLASLARHCRDADACALFALTYNGESRCDPAEPEDELVRDLMNRHQRQNDKGFGRAAGPEAAEIAARAFETVGYCVRRERSDWHLAAHQRELQRQLIDGWAAAAIEFAADARDAIGGWVVRRLAHIDAGRSEIVVGHEDLAAWKSDLEV